MTSRQAVVVIHGMGEQLPLDTLTRFVDAALAPDVNGEHHFYSRPESVTGSFESRRFLAPTATMPGQRERIQTEFFEYHWADRMQGNRLDDLWPTFRRILLQPWRAPRGLRGIVVVSWAAIAWLVWASVGGPLRGVWSDGDGVLAGIIGAMVSGAFATALLSYLLSRLLPGWLTSSFVDVVRYLDTSPRSYGVRRDIRKGLIEMLQALHDDRGGEQHYERIVIVAHSLGAFIAYDAIAYLWGLSNTTVTNKGSLDLAGLSELEELVGDEGTLLPDVKKERFQHAQNKLFYGMRATGNPWLISDFVSVGTPMYFADRLLAGRDKLGFAARKMRRELPTCPPWGEDDLSPGRSRYSWRLQNRGAQVLHEGAPFAVVRWTNLYFPTRWAFFGDWFGGALAPLYGGGIRDVEVLGNTPKRYLPAYAHSLYFRFPDDSGPDSVTTALRDAMWLTRSTMPLPAAATSVPASEQ